MVPRVTAAIGGFSILQLASHSLGLTSNVAAPLIVLVSLCGILWFALGRPKLREHEEVDHVRRSHHTLRRCLVAGGSGLVLLRLAEHLLLWFALFVGCFVLALLGVSLHRRRRRRRRRMNHERFGISTTEE
jgi:hypothetical protein